MSYSRRPEYSRSPSPYKRYSSSRSVSRSLSRSMSRSRSPCRSRELREVENPGNNLYVTGLSPRVTKRELEERFSSEGTVVDVHLVVDPRTRDSRGFGFVTMSTVEEANRCIKYLDRSVLEGRVIMVEKARRRRGRTPTPGRYLGLRTVHVRRRSPSYSPYHRSHSPRYSSERDRSRSSSPYYGRHKSHHSHRSNSRSRPEYRGSPLSLRKRSYSPVDRYYSRRDRSYSPCDHHYSRRDRSYSPYDRHYSRRDRSYSPYDPHYRRDRSYSPYGHHYSRRDRSYSPGDRYYRRSRYRSISRSISPRARMSSKRYSPSVSPKPKRNSRRSYSPSVSPRRTRSSRREDSGSSRRGYSRVSYSSRSPLGAVVSAQAPDQSQIQLLPSLLHLHHEGGGIQNSAVQTYVYW